MWIYNVNMLYRVLKNGNLVAIVLKFAPNFAFARA